MNKFLIKTFEQHVSNFEINSNSTVYHRVGHPFEFSIELVAIEVDHDSIKKLSDHFKYNKPISLESCEYHHWTEPFKNEFKEFLQERYPEKILSDLNGFDIMFGE